MERLGSKKIALVAGALATAMAFAGMSTPAEAQVEDDQNKCVEREEPGLFYDYDNDGTIDNYRCVALPGCHARLPLTGIGMLDNVTLDQQRLHYRARIVTCIGESRYPDFYDFYDANPWVDDFLRPDTLTQTGRLEEVAEAWYDSPSWPSWVKRYVQINGISTENQDSSTEEAEPVEQETTTTTTITEDTTTPEVTTPAESDTGNSTTEEAEPVEQETTTTTTITEDTTTPEVTTPAESDTGNSTTEEAEPVEQANPPPPPPSPKTQLHQK